MFVLDLHITEVPKENLNINVRLKLHPIALHTGSEPTRVINVPEVSFKQLWATKINLLLGKLPVSPIPHYPPALVIQKRWKWILAKGSRKPARHTGGNVFIQPCCPQLFHELLWVYLDGTFRAGNGKINSRVKRDQVRNVLGSGLRDCRAWRLGRGGRQALRGFVILSSCSQGLERLPMNWPSSPPVISACLDAGCHGAVRITDLNGMKQWNEFGLPMEFPPSSNVLLMPSESLKKNP